MFIKQTIAFELRGPRKLLWQTKDLHRKFSGELLFTAKNIAEGNEPCFPSPGLSQLQNLSKKCLALNVNCKQRED